MIDGEGSRCREQTNAEFKPNLNIFFRKTTNLKKIYTKFIKNFQKTRKIL